MRAQLPGGEKRSVRAFCLDVQIFAKVGGGKGQRSSCSRVTRSTWIFSKKKESSKREVKIGTTPSLEKDGKAIKVFPGC